MTDSNPKTKRKPTVYVIQKVVDSTRLTLQQMPGVFETCGLAQLGIHTLDPQDGDEYQIVNIRKSCVMKTSPSWD